MYANAFGFGHVTLLRGEFLPLLNFFSQSDLGRRADSRWALPQIFSLIMTFICICLGYFLHNAQLQLL